MDIYDRLYKALKYYVYNASPEELKEHYEWYNVEIGDKEDLIDTMYESYYDNFDEFELEDRIKNLYEIDVKDFKLGWINNLENVSKIIELLIQDDSITSQIKNEEFIELTKKASYYKIDEVIDYLEELRKLERKNSQY